MAHSSPPKLIVACDVDYRETRAVAAGVWFEGWTASEPKLEAIAHVDNVAPYQPGEFFRRELPCLLEVLKRGPEPDIIIVDGYVWLDAGRSGLGDHLYRALGSRVAVVGVAKTAYAGAPDAVPVLRGTSSSPLFVSSVGIDLTEVVIAITSMRGPHRLPTLLKHVDQLARRTS